MKKQILLTALAFINLVAFAQISDWNNGGGNPSRNGYSLVNGPSMDSLLWQAAPAGLFGMPMYIEGNKLVTMRFISMSNAPIECYDLTTGELLWQKEITGLAGRSLPVGFRDNQVYAVRYTESLADTLYALSADDGSKVWTADVTVDPYITASATFASNGDLFIERYFKMCRISSQSGQMIWETDIVPFSLGVGELSVFSNTGYLMEQVGGVAYVAAIDLDNGQKKYSFPISDTHPGGGINQCPLMVGPDGTIYVHKQGDNVTALSDNGSELSLLWETAIFGNSPFSQMCVGSDGSVYAPSSGMVVRLDPLTGQITDSSEVISTNPELFQLRLSATQNDLIFATNGENSLYAFSLDLNEIWSDNVPNVNTSGAAIGTDGVIAVSGANIIKVYTPGISSGTREIPGDVSVTFYPNPVSDKLTIQVRDNLRSPAFLICDQTGRQVRNGKLVTGTNTVNVNDLVPGIYLLNIEADKSCKYKFVKQ